MSKIFFNYVIQRQEITTTCSELFLIVDGHVKTRKVQNFTTISLVVEDVGQSVLVDSRMVSTVKNQNLRVKIFSPSLHGVEKILQEHALSYSGT